MVWATKYRQPTLTPARERAVYRVLYSEVRRAGCLPVALNGTADHVHLLIQLGSDVTLSRLANQLKGASAHFINETRDSKDDPLFQWQEGYGVFSVGKNQIKAVVLYINRQKQRHAAQKIWLSLEPREPADIVSPPISPP